MRIRRGFSLIEVVLAFGVLAFVAAAAVDLPLAIERQTALDADYQAAATYARRALDRWQARPFSGSSGELEATGIRLDTAPQANGEPRRASLSVTASRVSSDLIELSASVAWTRSGKPARFTLSTLKARPDASLHATIVLEPADPALR